MKMMKLFLKKNLQWSHFICGQNFEHTQLENLGKWKSSRNYMIGTKLPKDECRVWCHVWSYSWTILFRRKNNQEDYQSTFPNWIFYTPTPTIYPLIISQQDGIPLIWNLNIRNYLDVLFPGRGIGRGCHLVFLKSLRWTFLREVL